MSSSNSAGADRAQELRQVLREIPDARERLTYVGQMTERAAHTVLDLIDAATPACSRRAAQSRTLAAMLQQAAGAPTLGLEEARRLIAASACHAADTAAFAQAQQQALSDILMAQDFQDLSGQVINKVVSTITRAENHLAHVVPDDGGGTAEPLAAPASTETLAGPQTPDKAIAQDDVDALLASMGF